MTSGQIGVLKSQAIFDIGLWTLDFGLFLSGDIFRCLTNRISISEGPFKNVRTLEVA